MSYLNRKKSFFVLILAAFVLTLAACGEGQPATGPEQQKIPVSVVEAVKGSLTQSTVVKGKITAQTEVNIIPKIGGKAAQVPVSVGDAVKAGDVLVRLETTEIAAQLKQAQATLAIARSNAENARTNLERMEGLYAEGAVSLQQLEQARLLVAQTDPAAAEAAVQLLQSTYDNMTLKTPISGVVTVCNATVGELLGQQYAAVVVVDMDKVLMETEITEQNINKIKVGQKVAVAVASAGDEPFPGEISSISPAADSRTYTYPLKIALANPGHILKPGMFAEAAIASAHKEDALIVSKEAVIANTEPKRVFVVREDKALLVEVETGLEEAGKVEILSGLQEGDLVVDAGQGRLTDGCLVDIREKKSL